MGQHRNVSSQKRVSELVESPVPSTHGPEGLANTGKIGKGMQYLSGRCVKERSPTLGEVRAQSAGRGILLLENLKKKLLSRVKNNQEKERTGKN